MSVLTATCPRHQAYDEACSLCVTASDVTNMSLHPLGQCDIRCRSLEHYIRPAAPERGVTGKSGILVYYPDGTTNADPLPSEPSDD